MKFNVNGTYNEFDSCLFYFLYNILKSSCSNIFING